jgi:hypothetical protein
MGNKYERRHQSQVSSQRELQKYTEEQQAIKNVKRYAGQMVAPGRQPKNLVKTKEQWRNQRAKYII